MLFIFPAFNTSYWGAYNASDYFGPELSANETLPETCQYINFKNSSEVNSDHTLDYFLVWMARILFILVFQVILMIKRTQKASQKRLRMLSILHIFPVFALMHFHA